LLRILPMMGNKNGSRARACALAALLCLCAVNGFAQQYYDPGVMQLTVTHPTDGYQPNGMRLGSWTLMPAVETAVEWHDNVYYTNTDQVRDTIYHIRPKASLVSGWSRHALTVSAIADVARFQNRSSEDYTDLILSMEGRIDVQTGKFFTVRAATMKLHEDRSSPDDDNGASPTEFTLDRFALGYTHNFNRLTGSLTWSHDKTRYDDNFTEDGGFVDNSDRNRTIEDLTLRLSYLQAAQRSLYLEAGLNRVAYDLPEDFEGFRRDSEGFRAAAGVNFDITGVLTGDLYIQYLDQEKEDPRFTDIDSFGFGAGLTWYPTRLTRLELRAEQTPLETTQVYSSGYLASLYSVRLQHELRRWLLLHARVSYTDNDYSVSADAPEDSLTNTAVTRSELGLSYLFNRHFYLTAGYARDHQDANLVIEQYTANRYFLVLGVQL